MEPKAREVKYIMQFLKCYDRVLEVGCGKGRMAFHIAPDVANYIATDVSMRMLKFAEKDLENYYRPSLRFEFADASSLKIPSRPYSVIIAINVLHLLDDLESSIFGFYEVLRPGGVLICKTPCLGDVNSILRSVKIGFDKFSGNAQGFYQKLSEKRLLETMVRSGFVIKEVVKLSKSRWDLSPYIVARKECI